MNQDVESTDAVTFLTLDTGQGANELFDMDQNVLTTSNVQFADLTLTGDLALNGDDLTSDGALNITPTSNLNLRADGDTDDYVYLDTTTNESSILWDGVLAYTNDPGFRTNASTGEIEYRDEDSASWVSIDSIAGASAIWTDGTGISYLTDTAEDFAVGGSTLDSAFAVDVSANTAIIGTGATANATLTMYASDNDTGNLVYNTSDQFQFSGGDVLIDQALTVTGAIAGATLDTGQGANELYDMDQNVLTTSTVTFGTVAVSYTHLTLPTSDLV